MINLQGTNLVKQYPNQVTKKPMVSVFVLTYKHEIFIRQCLDGILMQKTNFQFEILLGEDDSPDKTREICIEYANKYPNTIRLFLHDRTNVIHIGGIPTGRYNFLYNLKQAKGKYIALCEGDDYWIDPLKLQKQVEFLERNKDYNLSVGRYKIYNQKTKELSLPDEMVNPNKKHTYLLKDYLKAKFSQTSTFVMRNNFTLPDWFSEVYLGDQSLVVISVRENKIHYDSRFLSVYRTHPNSVSSKISIPSKFNKYLLFYRNVNAYTNRKYEAILYKRLILSLPSFFKAILIRSFLNIR